MKENSVLKNSEASREATIHFCIYCIYSNIVYVSINIPQPLFNEYNLYRGLLERNTYYLFKQRVQLDYYLLQMHSSNLYVWLCNICF